jgi:hypothetical protein
MHFTLPAELAEQIDALAGPGGRSAYIEAVVELELRRRRLALLKSQRILAAETAERLYLN